MSIASARLKSTSLMLLAFLLGAAAVVVYFQVNDGAKTQAQNEPLYWVAPMDSNYRRDKPGKSPMGMDLVPVYEEPGNKGNPPGLISISPRIENSLGVRTELVEQRPLDHSISATAYVRFNEHNLIHIHPRVSGWVEKLYVKADGDPVQNGAALYALYSPELVNAQEEYVLALSRENPRLVKATENRLKALQLSEEFIADLRESQNIKQSVTFHSPQQGFVDHLAIREGYFVQPGTTMFSIASLKSVWLELEVPESLASGLELGATLDLNLDFAPTRTWQGRIDYIYPVINETTRSVRARALIENPDSSLKPNMYARATIFPTLSSSYLSVSNEAIIRTGKQDRVVMALGQGQYKSVEVKVGRRAARYSEIVDGLQQGDRVVASTQFLLDSESSKNSDFKRYDQNETASVESAIVDGRINSINVAEGTVNISRGPIEKWNRGPATMDFLLKPGIALELKTGDSIRFKFEIRDGKFHFVELLEHLESLDGDVLHGQEHNHD